MKKTMALLLTGAMVFSMTAAGAASAAEDGAVPMHNAAYSGTAHSATTKHESISVAMDVEPGDLSPEAISDSGGNMWKWQVYEHLFDINGLGGDLVGRVAESYEQIDDVTYRIYLRKGVYDSDGNELHASDVIYAYDTLLAAGNRMSGDIAKYDHGEVVDDYTVDLVMNTALDGLSDLSAILGQPYVYCEAAVSSHNLAIDPCGTGPYIVTQYDTGSQIIMEASDNYWAEGADFQTIRMCANVQTITYKVVAENAQNAIGLQTGELDFSGYISATDISSFEEGGAYADQFQTISYLDNLTTALFENCDSEKSLCSDLNLRLAINYALDGTQLGQASGTNDFVTASTLGNAKYPDYVKDWETQENYYTVQDLSLAQEYLSKSDYNGETLVLALNNAADLVNVATAIQAMLLNIGINVEIDAEDSTIIDTKQVNGEYDLLLTKMASDDYLPIVWYRWYSDDFHSVSHTICNCDDDTLRELLAACIVKGGNTEENLKAFQDYVVENAYGYGLYSNCVSDVMTIDITEPCWNFQDYIIPGGCIYADNEF